MAISTAGSIVGVLPGAGGATAVTALMRSRTEALIFSAVTPGTIVVSMAAAVAVGLLFGTYPALRAARLSPGGCDHARVGRRAVYAGSR